MYRSINKLTFYFAKRKTFAVIVNQSLNMIFKLHFVCESTTKLIWLSKKSFNAMACWGFYTKNIKWLKHMYISFLV